jgi:hypothetical protein
MKKCPECNRTYADDSIAFCLVDGAVLSAPFDSEPTLVLPVTSSPIIDKSNVRQPTKLHFSYVVILILVILVAGGGVALFYERSKSDQLSSNTKSSGTSESIPVRDLNGEWEMVNTVESSSNASYINARVAFRLFIKQVGQEITADGEKIWITGRALESTEHTPIHITGLIKGDSVEATFVEEGLKRKSSGRFVWKFEGNKRLGGTFVTTAADSSGRSVVTRKQ